jgi:hypothetical protein
MEVYINLTVVIITLICVAFVVLGSGEKKNPAMRINQSMLKRFASDIGTDINFFRKYILNIYFEEGLREYKENLG